ncbi:hypothetical protein [Campylobacter sp.]|uniref:hypothetical protein n=1 Tax=Campylobacter sp. TaxID=205 RepID=UPI0026FFF7C4|nr:hypothetical protein [Campylobacter sp.]
MKLGEFYSVVCKIFALDFSGAINDKIFEGIKRNGEWFIRNESEANLKGRELYKEALDNETSDDIRKDFKNLEKYFVATHFFESDDERLAKLYQICGFEPNLKSLKIDSISNQLSFLSAVIKLEANEKTEEILGVFLSSYLLPYAAKLAVMLQKEAKSKFYRSLGYLFEDFANGLEKTLKIKVVPR